MTLSPTTMPSSKRESQLQVAFIFGEKALRAMRQAALPARVLRMLDEAPKHPEGTGLRFEIKTTKDIAVVKKLAAIKLQH